MDGFPKNQIFHVTYAVSIGHLKPYGTRVEICWSAHTLSRSQAHLNLTWIQQIICGCVPQALRYHNQDQLKGGFISLLYPRC